MVHRNGSEFQLHIIRYYIIKLMVQFKIKFVLLTCLFSLISCQIIDVKQKIVAINRSYGLSFSHDISKFFVVGQYYRFYGQIEIPQFSKAVKLKQYSIEATFINLKEENNFKCFNTYQIQNKSFQLSCKIAKEGKFFIKVVAFASDSSTLNQIFRFTIDFKQTRYVRTGIDFTAITNIIFEATIPKGLQVVLSENKNVVIKWNSYSALSKLTFSQIKKNKQFIKKQFILSNYHQSFQPPIEEFQQFQTGSILVSLSHSDSFDGTLTFILSPFRTEQETILIRAAEHFKATKKYVIFQIVGFIQSQITFNTIYILTLIFSEPVQNFYYLYSIDKKTLQKINVSQQSANGYINKGTPVKLYIKLPLPGTYIVQMFTQSQQVALNIPFYTRNTFPLIPKFYGISQTIQESKIEKKQKSQQKQSCLAQPNFNSTLQQKRQYLLQNLNNVRQINNLPSLKEDQHINQLAQIHSQDMSKNNYLSIINSKGEYLNERALIKNISSLIKQFVVASQRLSNICIEKQQNLKLKQLILNKYLTRIGIGISQKISNQTLNYFITFDFSVRDLTRNPLMYQQMQKFQKGVIKAIMKINPNITNQNTELSRYVEQWLKQLDEGNYAEGQLEKFLLSKGYKNINIVQKQLFFFEDQLELLKQDSNFSNSKSKEVGAWLKVNKDGRNSLTLFAVYL